MNTFIAVGKYENSKELIPIMNFIIKCANNKVIHYMNEIFYDGEKESCRFDLDSNIKLGDPIEKLLFEYACQNIPAFKWFGVDIYMKENRPC